MAEPTKPLNLRCAESLGMEPCDAWKLWGLALAGPEFTKDAGACQHQHCYPRDQPPPFGDYSPSGWAWTGPLVTRFDIRLEKNGPNYYAWTMRADGTALRTGPDAADPCAAIAEWIAEHGAKARA